MNMNAILFYIVLISLLTAGSLDAQRLKRSTAPSSVPGWNNIDINEINATISYDGIFADYRRTGSSSVIWPKGTTKTSVFTSGLWVIGKHATTGQLRTAVMDYSSEYQPGKILTTFNTTTNSPSAADDPNKEIYKLYKVTRGIKSPDQQQWPAHLGAPFKDVNNNGVYDAGIDDPVVWGHQQLWSVSNDADSTIHRSTGMTPPIGLELQSTYFGYSVAGPLNNTVFLRYTIINKSDADYDNVYLSYFADIDLGDANDDMAAVDTIRSLAYVYNADNDDAGSSGYGSTPPATGFMLLQGPKVGTGNINDSAFYRGKKIHGYKNLSMTSHAVYIGGSVWNDPPLGSPSFVNTAYNYQQGLIGPTGQPYIDVTTNLPSKFVFPGDPITQSGWTQLVHGFSAGDIRSLLSTGPFTFAKGDTQEIVVAYVIAGGTDRLNSIKNLRDAADVIRGHFEENFASLASTQPLSRLYFSPSPLRQQFNKVNLGSRSDTAHFHFANIGSDSIVLSFGNFTHSSFVRTSPTAGTVTLAGNSTATVAVIFQPTGTGTFTDSLVITTTDSLHPRVVISVSGVGANVTPAETGTLYATDGMALYRLTPSSGAATHITNFEFPGITRLAVRPSTKELYYLVSGATFRISSLYPSLIQTPFAIGRNVTSGMSFLNDTTIVCAAESLLLRFYFTAGRVDTIHKFPSAHRLRALTYHPGTNRVFYSLLNSFPFNPDTVDAVYAIDVGTKAITRIGRIKIGERFRAMLSDVNGKLYGLVDSVSGSSAATYLVNINTSTGAGTMIGSTGINALLSLAMDPSSPASVRPVDVNIPQSFVLEQNYPNPFNPTTTIRFSLPEQRNVVIGITDMLGRNVAELTNERYPAGSFDVQWNGRDRNGFPVASGIYFYHITAGYFRDVKKMMLLK